MEGSSHKDNVPRDRFREPGALVLVESFLGTLIPGLFFFAAAGRLDLPRGWLFLAVSFAWTLGNMVVVALVNPGLLNHRGAWKKDTKTWDRKLLRVFGVLVFNVLPIVMGLDVGRCHWSNLGLWATVVGIAVFSLGWIIFTWAMLVNPHFEVTVRIQTDRNHRVVTAGPYAVVRHPGYVGASLCVLGSPPVVGSACGLIPAAIAVGLLVLRTYLEDRTLQAELVGYAAYAQRVRYRLLPGIW